MTPDISGCTFNHLTAIRLVGISRDRHAVWEFKCSCGALTEKPASRVRSGKATSCGCVRAAGKKPRHGMCKSREYQSWCDMLKRCTNPNLRQWKDYGGRGIRVCERWLLFDNFIADMGRCPEGLTIERVNNDLGYFPENCVWADRVAQARNKRNSRRTKINHLINEGQKTK